MNNNNYSKYNNVTYHEYTNTVEKVYFVYSTLYIVQVNHSQFQPIIPSMGMERVEYN